MNDSFGPKPPSFEDLSNLDHSAHLIDEEEEVKEARLESDGNYLSFKASLHFKSSSLQG